MGSSRPGELLELRNILPWSMTAGSWKHRLLPNEVAAWTKTSWPSRAALMISLWCGLRKVVRIGSWRIMYHTVYSNLKFSLPNCRRRVKSMSLKESLLRRGIATFAVGVFARQPKGVEIVRLQFPSKSETDRQPKPYRFNFWRGWRSKDDEFIPSHWLGRVWIVYVHRCAFAVKWKRSSVWPKVVGSSWCWLAGWAPNCHCR